MKIAKGEKLRVFYKRSDEDGSENIYTGVISNIGGEQRRAYMSVYMNSDLKLEFLEVCEFNDKSYADIDVIYAWITCDMRSRPAIYIQSGRIPK